MASGFSLSTLDRSLNGQGASRSRQVGLVHVLTGATPLARGLRFAGADLELGRDERTLGDRVDPRLSRRHARVRRVGGRLIVSDLGSHNGTYVDGQLVAPGTTRELTRVLRIGESLFVPTADAEALERLGVRTVNGFVRGPALQQVLDEVGSAAAAGATLHIHGESGTGKEGIADAFHAAGPRRAGPFVPVNCAAIPSGIAERLLFGARKGAYSGADADVHGYFQAAHGGTIFLDEIVDLDAAVQAKLLRVLESGEVMALGATLPRGVELGVCSASNRDLRGLVAAGKLREDLFFRLAQPEVQLPALRDRPEEIPFLLATAAGDRALHVSFVEACLLRPWPGNVRELLAEARAAAQRARAARAPRLEAQHLRPTAGTAFAVQPPEATPPPEPAAPPATAAIETRPSRPLDAATRDRIVAALDRAGGNITGAARELGVHRTQLRRLLARHEIPVGSEVDA